MTDLHNDQHLKLMSETITKSVSKYFNDEVPYKPIGGGKKSVYEIIGLVNPDFNFRFSQKLAAQIDLFNNERQYDVAVLDERGFELDPKEYKSEILRNCSYVDIGFKMNNRFIKYPFNRGNPEEILAKIKNIKSFIDSNIEKRKIPEKEKEAIMELADLKKEEYTFRIKDDRKEWNEHLLGAKAKSKILFHCYPEYYPEMTTNDLFSLFMLTAGANNLSQNCEFVIYRNRNWVEPVKNYPYELFTYYGSVIFEQIKKCLSEKGENTDGYDNAKYVVVEAFLQTVYKYNEELLETLKNSN